jgi:beta-N-acetylhexosaminidase
MALFSPMTCRWKGAGIVGGMLNRVDAAYRAGCDMLLVCNAPESVAEVLAEWHPEIDPARGKRVEALLPASAAADWQTLQISPRYLAAQEIIARLTA